MAHMLLSQQITDMTHMLLSQQITDMAHMLQSQQITDMTHMLISRDVSPTFAASFSQQITQRTDHPNCSPRRFGVRTAIKDER